jgi:predicted lipoprotein
MLRFFPFMATGLFLLAAVPAGAASLDSGATVTRSIADFVRPGYVRFHDATTALDKAAANLCKAPSGASLEAARAAFSSAIDSWSQIEIIRFGPVTEENRLERILFWPDRKSIGLKQVQAALAERDRTASDAKELAGKSVAMQGLGALEFVLYGTGAEELSGQTGSFRCAYGAAISKNLDEMASELAAEWADLTGFSAKWQDFGDKNPLYRNADEALTELLEVFVNGLELIRDQRLGGFLGDTEKADKPKQALFWRSGKTADALKGNMEGLKTLFDASGIGPALPEASRWIAQSANFEFGNAINAAEATKGPVDDVLANPEKRGKLAYFGVVTSSLSEIFGTRLAAELGLTAGFSSLDGD